MDRWGDALRDYSGCSDRLEGAVSQLTAEQLDQAPEGGGWTPRQIVHHLGDGSWIWSLFIHQALAGKGGDFNLSWYWDQPQEAWSEIWRYAAREIGPSLQIYRANQERLIPLLETIDNPDQLALTFNVEGQEPETVSILEAIRFQPQHLDEHLAEIKKILGMG